LTVEQLFDDKELFLRHVILHPASCILHPASCILHEKQEVLMNIKFNSGALNTVLSLGSVFSTLTINGWFTGSHWLELGY